MPAKPRDAEARRAALALGVAMERLVEASLIADGWTIRDRNWRGGGGELDIVAVRGGELRVVEVKARDLSDPLSDEAVTSSKRSKLRAAARAWMEDHAWQQPAAFLVAMVDVRGQGVDWIDDAFDG